VETILVVDDDADIRQLVTELLRLSGYDVSTAGNGRQALDRLGAGPLPSLVLLDVQMPELDGWDALRTIRSRAETASLPVILCTVKSSAVDQITGWTLGCDGYLVKPFAIADILAMVETVVGLDDAGRAERRADALRALAASSAGP
jgi:DNA-binding response OmpR family regulator